MNRVVSKFGEKESWTESWPLNRDAPQIRWIVSPLALDTSLIFLSNSFFRENCKLAFHVKYLPMWSYTWKSKEWMNFSYYFFESHSILSASESFKIWHARKKNSADNMLKYFSYFSKKINHRIMQSLHWELELFYLISCLTLTMLWADSADNKLMIFFLFSLENRIWHFMQIVSLGDNLHEV